MERKFPAWVHEGARVAIQDSSSRGNYYLGTVVRMTKTQVIVKGGHDRERRFNLHLRELGVSTYLADRLVEISDGVIRQLQRQTVRQLYAELDRRTRRELSGQFEPYDEAIYLAGEVEKLRKRFDELTHLRGS